MYKYGVTCVSNNQRYTRIYTYPPSQVGQVPEMVSPNENSYLHGVWLHRHGVNCFASFECVGKSARDGVMMFSPGIFFKMPFDKAVPTLEMCYHRAMGYVPRIETPSDELICVAGLVNYVLDSGALQ